MGVPPQTQKVWQAFRDCRLVGTTRVCERASVYHPVEIVEYSVYAWKIDAWACLAGCQRQFDSAVPSCLEGGVVCILRVQAKREALQLGFQIGVDLL